jgi:hypothetical protein
LSIGKKKSYKKKTKTEIVDEKIDKYINLINVWLEWFNNKTQAKLFYSNCNFSLSLVYETECSVLDLKTKIVDQYLGRT